jgi:UDP-N-acetylmuramoyl-tripeptide--D-alanyl-D-alanine ligase
MQLSIDQILQATGGSTVRSDTPGSDLRIEGVSTDSRTVAPGNLFVPLRAERDGHDFIDAARAAGAVAHLTERDDDRPGAVRVADTAAALMDLGRLARTLLPDRLIGVTGSSGKTTTKDMISAVLARRGPHVRSDKSFNNEIGVPLTLLNAPGDSWAGIIEMGARGIGHIAKLMGIARPRVGIALNVGRAHVGMYADGQLGIARAKGEIVEGLPVGGVAVLNADDPLVIAMANRTRADILRFSTTGKDAEISAQSIVLGADLRASFVMHTPWGSAQVRLGVPGEHQPANALAAVAACGAVGSTLDEIVAGLSEAQLSPWRMELLVAADGYRLLNDSYNANPESMAAGLRSLAAMPARRRVAVLGEMAELGVQTGAGHAEVAALAAALGVEVIAVGSAPYGVASVASGVEEAAALLAALDLGPDDAVLLKASRVAGLERLARLLAPGPGSDR